MSIRNRILTAPAAWSSPRNLVFNCHPAANDLGVVAVVDTNVVLDIFSCHGVSGAYDKLGSNPIVGIDDPEPRYRRARARQAIVLALYFNASGAATYSLRGEPVRLLVDRVPPRGQTIETAFTTEVIHFVRSEVLSDWRFGGPDSPETEQGNAADAKLVEVARDLNVPLITYEGLKTSGDIDDTKKIRALARKQGVIVVTPEEFYAGKLVNERALIDDFMARFSRLAPKRIRTGPKHLPELLKTMFGYYKHVLFGETEGRELPVSVAL